MVPGHSGSPSSGDVVVDSEERLTPAFASSSSPLVRRPLGYEPALDRPLQQMGPVQNREGRFEVGYSDRFVASQAVESGLADEHLFVPDRPPDGVESGFQVAGSEEVALCAVGHSHDAVVDVSARVDPLSSPPGISRCFT